jgi:hypothetical protein
MTPAEALKAIRGLASANRIAISSHAYRRMNQRGATFADVHHALTHAQQCAWQAQHQRWKVESADLDGDDLTLAVVIEDDVIVVTLF